jgi:hypothetical protein
VSYATPRPFTAISAIAGVVIFACALYFAAFPFVVAPRFAAMFEDFGSIDALPFITKLALRPVTSTAALLFLAGGTAGGVVRPRERPLILSLTAGGGIALVLLTTAALYLPIIALAGQIK